MTGRDLKKLLTYDNLKDITTRLGFPVYNGTYDLNLGFIRSTKCEVRSASEQANTNSFDDIMYIFYTDEYGKTQVYTAWCTTDPGLSSIITPANPKGCAIIKEGYYHKAFITGLHKGKRAMVNRQEMECEPITVIRDFDRDANLDYASGREETGYFGIDLHGARADRVCQNVDNWSEGCIVLPDIRDMNAILELADLQHKYGNGKHVSFALIRQDKFERILQ